MKLLWEWVATPVVAKGWGSPYEGMMHLQVPDWDWRRPHIDLAAHDNISVPDDLGTVKMSREAERRSLVNPDALCADGDS